MEPTHKRMVRRYTEEVWIEHDADIWDELTPVPLPESGMDGVADPEDDESLDEEAAERLEADDH